jgi:DNA-binding protein HU-beta
MNKQELIDQLAERTGETKKACKAVLDAFTQTVGDTLKKGESVTLIGFGTYSIVETQARTGRNPQTGKPIEIKAKKKPKFKAGSELADKVN